MIVDAHIHIHPFPSAGNGVKMPPGFEDGMRSDLERLGIQADKQAETAIQRMDAAGVDAAIVVNPKHPYETGHVRTNQSVYEAISPYKGRLFALAGIHLLPTPDLAELELAVTKLGFRGLKLLAGQQARPNDFDLLDPLYKKLIELDVPIMWHPGPSGFGKASSFAYDCGDYYDLACRHPQLQVVIAHAGHGARGGEDLAASVAGVCRNVYIDMSAVLHSIALRFMPPPMREPGRWGSRLVTKILYPPGGAMEPEYRPVWDSIRHAYAETIRNFVNRAPGRILYGTDLPFADRWDMSLPIFREAIPDEELLAETLGEAARRLFKLDAGKAA